MKHTVKYHIKSILHDRFTRRLARDSSGAFLIKIIGMVIAYLFTILLTRSYGADVFGLYSLALIVMSIGSIFSRLGIDTASIKFVPGLLAQKEEESVIGFYLKGLLVTVILSMVAGFLLYVFSDTIANLIFNKNDLVIYIRIIGMTVILHSVLQFNSQMLRAFKAFNWHVAFHGLLMPLSGLIILSIFVSKSGNQLEIYELYFLSVLTICIISFLLIGLRLKNIHFSLKKSRQGPSIGDILNVSLPMFLFGSTMLFSEWVSTLMIGMLGTAEDVAVYKVIVRIGSLAIIALAAVNTVLATKISSKYHQNDISGMNIEIQKASRLIFWVSLPIQVILFASAELLLDLFGSEFKVGLSSLYVLLLGQFFNSISGPVMQVLNMTNGQRYLRNVSMIRLLSIISLNFFLFPSFGILGVAISLSSTLILVNIVCLYKVYHTSGCLVFYMPRRLND